jgi:hypothetical protein
LLLATVVGGNRTDEVVGTVVLPYRKQLTILNQKFQIRPGKSGGWSLELASKVRYLEALVKIAVDSFPGIGSE